MTFVDKDLYTPAEVAEIMVVKPVTVATWLRKGMIQGVKTRGKTGHWRIPRAELQRIINERHG